MRRRIFNLRTRLVGLAFVGWSVASAIEITPEEAMRPPRAQWITTALDPASQTTWSELERVTRSAAIAAESRNQTVAMERWLIITRWARLMNSDQRQLTDRWINAMNAAELGHPNLPRTFAAPSAPLSAAASPTFATWAINDADFSRTFFDLITPYDYVPRVVSILSELHARSPDEFADYAQLALAIALVFDVAPPPNWPHGQVSPTLLSRRLPSPADAFAFWVAADKRRVTLHRLNRLQASELKFVVAAAAPFAELGWAQGNVRFDFAGLPRAYDAVAYQTERADNGVFAWPGSSYALPVILQEGGICIDQAYFASEVGRARGVPTLLFRGVGLDGRHAWFGYLDAQRKWQLDVGRYAEQRFVSGVAFDPQTWGDVNDHELAFLAERFRALPAYQQSRARQFLAQEYLRIDDPGRAAAVARKAVNHEPRNVAAWHVLILAERLAGIDALKREGTLRRAARAFARYPDLNARFMTAVVASLRERGQTSAAEQAERTLARKFAADRSDIALAQAAEMLNRTLADDGPAVQLRVFESALRQFGAGAGVGAFDRLVKPFFRQLLAEQRLEDAARAVQITRRLVPIEAGSQFDQEMQALVAELNAAIRPRR